MGLGSYISSRFFENQPNEICSHLSEKASKGRFFAPDISGSKITLKKEKERRKERARRRKGEEKKSNGCSLSFYSG